MGQDRLRIVHVVRAPIGGIFRHVVDLAAAQAEAGHEVGIVCDALAGGAFEQQTIDAISSKLALGAKRFPMRRQVSLSDLLAARNVLCHLVALEPDVIHSHGAKGGVYGRLIGTWLGRKRPIARIYSPHGGSLHYEPRSLEGRIYFTIERALQYLTDALVHVSKYEADTYRSKVGAPRCQTHVIRNGLRADEFVPVIPAGDARDLLYLGMLRDLKGLDVFIHALAKLERGYGRKVHAHVVGQADDLLRYQGLARALGIADQVAFHQPKPTREAFAMARAIVVPSRAESMPYVVLEAIAAGLPIVATHVGGIPEIFGPHAHELVPPGDADALAAAIADLLDDPARAKGDAEARREWVRPRFNIELMQGQIGKLYQDILGAKRKRRRADTTPASQRARSPRYLP